MSWQASVDRVLQLRREHQLEQEKRQLLEIVAGLEERTKCVVNRERFPVLKEVPRPAGKEKARTMARVGGLRTFADTKRRVEKGLRVESDRVRRRAQEIEQVLSGNFPQENDAAEAAEEKHDGESKAV